MRANVHQWHNYIQNRLDSGDSLHYIKTDLVWTHKHDWDFVDKIVNDYELRNQNRKIADYVFIFLMSLAALLFFIKSPTITGLSIDYPVSVRISEEVIGTVNPYFYGVNTHGIWGSNESWIDTDGDGVNDIRSDYQWHRDKLIEANIKYIRADMGLGSVFRQIGNLDAERWRVISESFVARDNKEIPVSWEGESVHAYGNIIQSTDSHGGKHAVKITNTGDEGTLFSKQDLGVLKPNHNYSFSVWIKSPDVVHAHIQRKDDWSTPCITYSSGNNEWELLSCSVRIKDIVKEGWRLVIETNAGEELIWDDATLLVDNQPFAIETLIDVDSAKIRQAKNLVRWAANNDIKIQYIASYMPAQLANISNDCKSDISRCSSYDNGFYAETVVQFIDQITENGLYADTIEIEVWNEPDSLKFWLPDLEQGHANRIKLYNNMYGVVYDSVKQSYPEIEIGGPAITSYELPGTTFISSFMKDNYYDFISIHVYRNDNEGNYHELLKKRMEYMYNLCRQHDSDCSNIIIDEFNDRNLENQLTKPRKQNHQLALAYSYGLNYHPQNISFSLYQWSESRSYAANEVYPEYPYRWSMVSEPSLDNATYVSYNVTKDFATFHSAGSKIYRSTSDDDEIRVVAGEDYLTIINGRSEEEYAMIENTGQLIKLQPYDVKHIKLEKEVILEQPTTMKKIWIWFISFFS